MLSSKLIYSMQLTETLLRVAATAVTWWQNPAVLPGRKYDPPWPTTGPSSGGLPWTQPPLSSHEDPSPANENTHAFKNSTLLWIFSSCQSDKRVSPVKEGFVPVFLPTQWSSQKLPHYIERAVLVASHIKTKCLLHWYSQQSSEHCQPPPSS